MLDKIAKEARKLYREYQVKRMKNYILPEAVYRQALWAVKDLNRLKAELNKEIDNLDTKNGKKALMTNKPQTV